SDGGYILGGGILGCGGSYFQRALVEKLDPQGRVIWAFAYPAGTADGVIWKIRQTADGGYVAVGSATSSGQNGFSGALISSSTAQVPCSGSGNSDRLDRLLHTSTRCNRPPMAATWRSGSTLCSAGAILIP